MAKNDILPANQGDGSQSITPMEFAIGSTATRTTENTAWFVGEVMIFTETAGTILPANDGTVDAHDLDDQTFIAMASSQDLLETNEATDGSVASPTLYCPVWNPLSGLEFVTRNVYNDSDTNLGPAGNGLMTGVNVGDTVGWWVDDSSTWAHPNTVHNHGIDINSTGLMITRFVDALGKNTNTAASADKVFFRYMGGTGA